MFPAKWIEYETKPPRAFSRCKAFNLDLPVQPGWKQSKHRVLIVIEHVDTEDLRSRRFLSSTAGNWLDATFKLARKHASHLNPDPVCCAAINFNYFKTYDLPPQEQQQAHRQAAQRVHRFIKDMKPHTVLVFGDGAYQSLTEEDPGVVVLKRGRPIQRGGVQWVNTIDLSASYQGKTQSFSSDSDEDEAEESKYDHANLLGFAARCVANALARRVVHQIDVRARAILVNTIDKFDRLYERLMAADVVAVDTETTGLERVTSKVLTIQFSFDATRSYVVPVYHRDSPFTREEALYIRKRLRRFFLRQQDPLERSYKRFLLGQNLKFDLTIIRQWLQIYLIQWRVWDLMAGEYALDENMKALAKCKLMGTGTGAYGLAWFCAWYGFDFYETNAFSKSDRATIATRDLSEPGLLEYMAMDTQVCFAIYAVQCERASQVDYRGRSYLPTYRKFVLAQMNNLVQIESIMEHRGDQLDFNWLLKLKDKNGPMLSVKKELDAEFRAMETVQKANKLIVKAEGIQSTGMWGKTTWMFSPGKPSHKHALFIDVLDLEPISHGKAGPKFDKLFQDAYKTLPEIGLFTKLSQLNALTSTYVNGFYQKLITDPDMRLDYRIRPGFGFTGTVTGRSNSYAPNLQNIPSRGKFAKYIKRMFVAPRGCLTLKMDYSSHEVRVWAMIAEDDLLCSLFVNGRWLRQQYRETGDEVFLQLMNTKGDIHKVNCRFFFRVDEADVTPEQRNSVKSIVFGAIYGRGARAIADQAKAEVEVIKELLVKFFERFPKASGWLETAKEHAVKHGYMYSPIGRMRNMHMQRYGLQNFVAATERRGANAPIQGLAADFGHTAALLYEYHIEMVVRRFELDTDKVLRTGVNTFVHDAIKTDAPYEYFLVCAQVLQWCATTGVMEYYKTHWGMKFPVELEVEFEIAGHDEAHWKWNWHEGDSITLDKGEEIGGGMRRVIRRALQDQKEVYPDLDIQAAEAQIWKVQENRPLMRYLNKHYPVMADWPDAIHLDTASTDFKKGLGRAITAARAAIANAMAVTVDAKAKKKSSKGAKV